MFSHLAPQWLKLTDSEASHLALLPVFIHGNLPPALLLFASPLITQPKKINLLPEQPVPKKSVCSILRHKKTFTLSVPCWPFYWNPPVSPSFMSSPRGYKAHNWFGSLRSKVLGSPFLRTGWLLDSMQTGKCDHHRTARAPRDPEILDTICPVGRGNALRCRK